MNSDQNAGLEGDLTTSTTTGESSIWKIMIGVFTSPTEAFAAFNLKPQILMVLLVSVILGIASGYFTADYSSKMQFDMLSHSKTIPPQQLEQMQARSANPNRILNGATGAVVQVVGGIILALIAWGLGGFVMGGDSTFKKVWGASLLGGLIIMVGAVVKIPLMMAKGNMYVSLGLAALFPTKDFTSVLYGFLYYFDAFMIWAMIVTGIGFGIIFNISRGKGIAIAILLDLIGFILMFGLMYAGMSLAGVEITFF
jgi:hypothetical protein